MSGMWPSSFASTRPMIQVKTVSGHARCKVRTTGSTWHVSPIADRRRMQTLRGTKSRVRGMESIGGAVSHQAQSDELSREENAAEASSFSLCVHRHES